MRYVKLRVTRLKEGGNMTEEKDKKKDDIQAILKKILEEQNAKRRWQRFADSPVAVLLAFLTLMFVGGGFFLTPIHNQVYNHIPTQIRELRSELREDIRELREDNQRQFDKIEERFDKMEARFDTMEELLKQNQ